MTSVAVTSRPPPEPTDSPLACALASRVVVTAAIASTWIAVAIFAVAGCEARGVARPVARDTRDDQALKAACFDDPSQCPEYREALETMCAQGDAEGCGRLASLVSEGIGGPQDDVRARRLATDACTIGSLFGCSNLVVYAMNGRGGPRDLQEAYRAGLTACRTAWERRRGGCKNLSLVLHKDDFVLDDAERAKALAIACDAFALRSCESLATYLIELDRASDLDERAYPAFRAVSMRMCQLGYGGSCANLAYLVDKGAGGDRDEQLAASAMRRGCTLGEADLCEEGHDPRGGKLRAWPNLMASSDGGDHFDRLSALEDAWGPCADEPGDDRVVGVELKLAPDRVPTLDAEGPPRLVECFHARFPWREKDPTPPSAELTLVIEYELGMPGVR